MKGVILGFAVACGAALMSIPGSAHAIEGTPCVEGQEDARVMTGTYGYIVYQCLGVWTYSYECDESGYCFIAG